MFQAKDGRGLYENFWSFDSKKAYWALQTKLGGSSKAISFPPFLYGEAGLQAVYPTNFNAPSEHGQMGLQAANPSDISA